MAFLQGLFGPPNVEKLKANHDIQGLIKALDFQKDQNVQQAAAQALVEIGAPAVGPIITFIENKNLNAQMSDFQILIKIGAPAVGPLIVALKDSSDLMQPGFAAVLAHIGAPAVEPLFAALKNSNNRVRTGAALALSWIDEPVVEPLIALLKDKNTCFYAAETLGRRGDAHAAIEPLIVAFLDGSSAAAQALGKLDDVRAIEPLIAALESNVKFNDGREYASLENFEMATIIDQRDKEVAVNDVARHAVVEALGNLGDARALQPLIVALQDGCMIVRAAAAEALGQIGDAHAIDSLRNVLNDKQLAVRVAVAKALHKFDVPERETKTAKKLRTDQAVDMLVNIYRQHPDGIYPGSEAERQVKAVGQAIHQAGSMDLMLAVHEQFKAKNYFMGRDLERVWDSIGEWKG